MHNKQRKYERALLRAAWTVVAALPLAFLLAGCQTPESLSIDYLRPAEISFPETLRRVAVLDNVPAATEPMGARFAHEGEKNYFHGDAAIATESLARSIADQNYFDEVVVCDSALRAADTSMAPRMLEQEEVERLTDELDVDFLIALEGVEIGAVRRLKELPQWGVCYGSVDATVLPTVRIYLPGRKSPMLTVSRPDSIFWEETGTLDYVEAFLVSDRRMVSEASEFAGTIPVKMLLPTWKTTQRSLYTGGSVDMRDAAVFARQQQWDSAIALWQRQYNNSKKPSPRFKASYNLALAHEMQDSIHTALEWIEKALTEAAILDKVPQADVQKVEALEQNATRSIVEQYYARRWPRYIKAVLYAKELKEREEEMVHLRTQMQRFDDEF